MNNSALKALEEVVDVTNHVLYDADSVTLNQTLQKFTVLAVCMGKENDFQMHVAEMGLEEKLLNKPAPGLDETVQAITAGVFTNQYEQSSRTR